MVAHGSIVFVLSVFLYVAGTRVCVSMANLCYHNNLESPWAEFTRVSDREDL